jgi:phage replication-related protein YjqB (UPF0714/DUF867 family)
MKTSYDHFRDLSRAQKEGKDFRIDVSHRGSSVAIVAPHGGKIEPGTSDIARAVAGDDLTCYCFEGIRSTGNFRFLHLPSTRFDEPVCLAICAAAEMVVTFHGAAGKDERVYVGGRHEKGKRAMAAALKAAGIPARVDTTAHPGLSPRNLCNRGRTQEGLQLELSRGFRKRLFNDPYRSGLTFTTEAFDVFVTTVRSVLAG